MQDNSSQLKIVSTDEPIPVLIESDDEEVSAVENPFTKNKIAMKI